MTKIIVSVSQKGGVGKTTTAAILAQAAVYRGKKALVIDLDPQGNLSLAIGANARHKGSYHLLTGTPAEKTIQHIDDMDIIAANRELPTLKTRRASARRLESALEPILAAYDVIVIDTPAEPGELQYNGVQAATEAVIPLKADAYCIQSLYQVTDTMRVLQKSNPSLKIDGVLFTQLDERTNLAKATKAQIIEKAALLNIPVLGTIRNAVAVGEAAFFQTSLYKHNPTATAAEDYLRVYDKIMNEGDITQ